MGCTRMPFIDSFLGLGLSYVVIVLYTVIVMLNLTRDFCHFTIFEHIFIFSKILNLNFIDKEN